MLFHRTIEEQGEALFAETLLTYEEAQDIFYTYVRLLEEELQEKYD